MSKHIGTLDQNAVKLTGTNAGNNVLEINNTGSGNLIDITNTGTGKDIDGTSSTWSFTKAGVQTLANGLTLDNGTNNVFEWNETVIGPWRYYEDDDLWDVQRGFRGGSWSEQDLWLDASWQLWGTRPTGECCLMGFRVVSNPERGSIIPTEEGLNVGTVPFRVASIPEPGSVVLLACGGCAVIVYAWRQRRRR